MPHDAALHLASSPRTTEHVGSCMICRKRLAGGLWARARREGAATEIERRNFGVADDVYAAGLLVAYMAFVPFCEPGSIDGPSLQVYVC